MAQIIKTYLLVILLVSLGFFGVGALATAQELRDVKIYLDSAQGNMQRSGPR